MKITIHDTESKITIQGNAEELRCSNSMSDGFSNFFRGVFNRTNNVTECEEPEEQEEED